MNTDLSHDKDELFNNLDITYSWIGSYKPNDIVVTIKPKTGFNILGKKAVIDGGIKVSLSYNGTLYGEGYLYGNYRAKVMYTDNGVAKYKIGFAFGGVHVKLYNVPEEILSKRKSCAVKFEPISLWLVEE